MTWRSPIRTRHIENVYSLRHGDISTTSHLSPLLTVSVGRVRCIIDLYRIDSIDSTDSYSQMDGFFALYNVAANSMLIYLEHNISLKPSLQSILC